MKSTYTAAVEALQVAETCYSIAKITYVRCPGVGGWVGWNPLHPSPQTR